MISAQSNGAHNNQRFVIQARRFLAGAAGDRNVRSIAPAALRNAGTSASARENGKRSTEP
jgi:hypothetical protein